MADEAIDAPGDGEPGETGEVGGSTNPSITWSEDYIDWTGFERDAGLPQVVLYEDRVSGAGPDVSSTLPTGLRIYANQPVLLQSRSNKKYAKARTIYHDREGPYFEVGQTLMVPEEFHGWFELVPGDFGRAPLCRTIAQVADIMPKKFFTRTNIRAIRIENDSEEGEDAEQSEEGTQQSYKERKIKAGTVLTVLGTFAAKWQTTASTGMFKRKSKEWTTIEMTYLKCKDLDGCEILIPVATRGKFSIVYEKGNRDARAVYTMKDILSDLQFPIKVRMVFGKAPVVPCIFTGMLILKEKSKSDCFVASTIMNKRNVLFEIPVNTECNVKKAVNEEDYENLRTFIDATSLCKKYANSFSAMIKLSPQLDTNQQTLQHIPTEKRKQRGTSLKNLDLITDISVTDDEPQDYFMEDSSDSDSLQSADMAPLALGNMMELREINLPRTGQTISSA